MTEVKVLDNNDSLRANMSPIVSNGALLLSSHKLIIRVPKELKDGATHSDQEAISPIDPELRELFSENVLAKVWRVATRDLENNNPPTSFPEYVPQFGSQRGSYTHREALFWTCGFFPGTLYALLERVTKYPQTLNWSQDSPKHPQNLQSCISDIQVLSSNLLSLCQAWSGPLHNMSKRTDTHDLGFIIMPALRVDYELTGNRRSLTSIITAGRNLASRYNAKVRAIRSWDLINKKDLKIISTEENFIVIIDSLCNLDLLFYASAQLGDASLAELARTHAHTMLRTNLRPESCPPTSPMGYKGQMYSTCHVANLDPATGEVKERLTAQGYAADSNWARGQAWGTLGYAQIYQWTHDGVFLETACGLAEYFLYRLSKQQNMGSKVPLWDFDAPIEDLSNPIQDSSAGAIAAYGMLLLSDSLAGLGQQILSRRLCEAALDIIRDLLKFSLAKEKARFVLNGKATSDANLAVRDWEIGSSFDAILKNATANNNVGANRRYWSHGLVYADYYLVQCGNQLLKMGLA